MAAAFLLTGCGVVVGDAVGARNMPPAGASLVGSSPASTPAAPTPASISGSVSVTPSGSPTPPVNSAAGTADSPVTGTLSSYLTTPPAGFALATGDNAGEGVLSATDFDRTTSTGMAAKLGFRDGYDAFFDENDSDNSVEVTLLRFNDDSGAYRFQLLLAVNDLDTAESPRTGTDPQIPGSVTQDATKADPKEGTDFEVIGRKANVVLYVDYEGNVASPAYSLLAQAVARAQYRALLVGAGTGPGPGTGNLT